ASVTSMITPPLSISARPVFRRRLVLCPLFCDMGLLFSGYSFQLTAIRTTLYGCWELRCPDIHFTAHARFAVSPAGYSQPRVVVAAGNCRAALGLDGRGCPSPHEHQRSTNFANMR